MTDSDIRAFLDTTGWAGSSLDWLAGDASFRRYARLGGGKRPALLMDSSAPHEDMDAFIRVAEHLGDMGLSAPEILAADITQGLAIIEDFGDTTYTSLLAKNHDAEALYALAVDCLIALHRHTTDTLDVPIYSDADFVDEHRLLIDWYAPAVGCPVSATDTHSYLQIWDDLLARARAMDNGLVLRDFHVDNLMYLPERDGVRACGLLDFQDARVGPLPYDLVSLLQDARRDVPLTLSEKMTTRYMAAFPDLDPVAFSQAGTILAAQRHCKVLGIFTRLSRRDGKSGYLPHIPRLWHLLETCLAHPVLGELRRWLDTTIPPTHRHTPDIPRQ